MNNKTELKWMRDIAQLFPACKRALIQTRMMLVGLSLVELLGTLFPAGNIFLFDLLVIALLCVPIVFAVVEAVWQSLSRVVSNSSFRLSKATFAKLLVLEFGFAVPTLPFFIIYWCIKQLLTRADTQYVGAQIVIVVLLCIMLIPVIWWMIKSSLACVLVCLEGAGIFTSIRTSHRLFYFRDYYSP